MLRPVEQKTPLDRVTPSRKGGVRKSELKAVRCACAKRHVWTCAGLQDQHRPWEAAAGRQPVPRGLCHQCERAGLPACPLYGSILAVLLLTSPANGLRTWSTGRRLMQSHVVPLDRGIPHACHQHTSCDGSGCQQPAFHGLVLTWLCLHGLLTIEEVQAHSIRILQCPA